MACFLHLLVTFFRDVRAVLGLVFHAIGQFLAIRSTFGDVLAQETYREQRHLLLSKGLSKVQLNCMHLKKILTSDINLYLA